MGLLADDAVVAVEYNGTRYVFKVRKMHLDVEQPPRNSCGTSPRLTLTADIVSEEVSSGR